MHLIHCVLCTLFIRSPVATLLLQPDWSDDLNTVGVVSSCVLSPLPPWCHASLLCKTYPIHLLTHCHPSLQSGYQITQKRVPIAERGFLEFVVSKDFPGVTSEWLGRMMRVAVKQIHLEQDSGQTQYNPSDPDGNTTMVDFSRSGKPLMMQ